MINFDRSCSLVFDSYTYYYQKQPFKHRFGNNVVREIWMVASNYTNTFFYYRIPKNTRQKSDIRFNELLVSKGWLDTCQVLQGSSEYKLVNTSS